MYSKTFGVDWSATQLGCLTIKYDKVEFGTHPTTSAQYRNAIDFDSFFGVLSKSGDLDKAAESFKKSISRLIHLEILKGTVPLLKGWLIKRLASHVIQFNIFRHSD